MSIFGSLNSPDGDAHLDSCARWVKQDDYWMIGNTPCDCGQPDSPLVYQGSHVLPSENDRRGGYVDLALIPGHVRFWRDNPDAPVHQEPDGPPEPFLRFGVNSETVILTRRNVEQVHASLTEWLELTA